MKESFLWRAPAKYVDTLEVVDTDRIFTLRLISLPKMPNKIKDHTKIQIKKNKKQKNNIITIGRICAFQESLQNPV